MLDDVRHAIRSLKRSPAFVGVAAACLALGVGASTALFGVVNAVLLRPLPFRDPDRLVMVWDSVPRLGFDRNLVSPLNFVDWQRRAPAFESMEAYTETFLNLVVHDGDGPERVYGLDVTAGFFETLGARPALGRLFVPDDVAGEERPLVLSHRLWQRRFGSDPAVVGRVIDLGRIVGVLPADFFFPSRRFEVFRASSQPWRGAAGAAPDPGDRWRRGRFLTVVARLRPGVGIAEARAVMDVVTSRLADEYPEANEGRGATVRPLTQELLGDVRPALLLLQGAVAFLLLIAATNVANLQLVRSLGRGRELATRAALGATRGRLVRQLLSESLVVATLGGGAGILLAFVGVRLIVGISPAEVPRIDDAGLIDWRVVAFSLVCVSSGGLVSGLLPALRASRTSLREALSEGGRGPAPARSRAQTAFAVAQLAASLVLLVGAGLLAKTFLRLQAVDPGFLRGESVAVDLTRSGVPREEWAPFFEGLRDRVGQLPGVRAAGLTSHLPLSGEEGRRSFSLADGRAALPGPTLDASFRRVSPGYFEAMGIPLRRGRVFREGETGVTIVNEAFARRFVPGRDPLRQHVVIEDGPARPREVIGVVGDVRHFALAEDAPPEMYVTHADRPWPNMTLVVRARSGDPSALIPGLRREVAALDASLPLTNVKTLEQYAEDSLEPYRFRMRLVGVFALAALVLAVSGLYAVVAYGVARRRHEIGVRMAVGADAAAVLRLVVGEGSRLVLLGVAVGLAGVLALTRVLRGLLYEVSTLDAGILGGVVVLLAVTSLAACYVPARRASRLDPLVATREGPG